MVLTLWTMDIPDPDELATFAVDPKSGAKSFFTAYDNPAVIKATHQAEVTTDTAKRQQFYNQVQAGAANDAFMAFLYYSPYPYATTSNVHGFYRHATRQHAHGRRLAEQVTFFAQQDAPGPAARKRRRVPARRG